MTSNQAAFHARSSQRCLRVLWYICLPLPRGCRSVQHQHGLRAVMRRVACDAAEEELLYRSLLTHNSLFVRTYPSSHRIHHRAGIDVQHQHWKNSVPNFDKSR